MTGAAVHVLPVLAGISYAVCAIFGKRATLEGGGVWRITFLTNWGMALLLLPVLFWTGVPLDWTTCWHVALTSLVAFVGQVAVFAGLRFGDVSVVTPVMGVKVLLVALFSVWMNGRQLPGSWWGAAVIAVVAAVLLGSGGATDRRKMRASITGGIVGAAAFACLDVLFERWGAVSGVWAFTTLVTLMVGIWSLVLIPFLEGPVWHLPRPALIAFVPSLLLNELQTCIMAYCIVVLNGAAWANLLYCSRGFWSVMLVWVAGGLLGSDERDTDRATMVRRLTGSLLLLVAIAIVLYQTPTSEMHG